MKIRSIACTQFAGVRDRVVSLGDGVNLLYGRNESGKSTLVHLLSRTLFQKARLDGRSDREFKELYFPAARRGGAVSGDFADGQITLETADGIYTLKKEWGADPRCTLSTPDGVIRDQKKIDALLKEILRYGEGVYADMLFSSQRSADAALQALLDASRRTDAKQEITDAVTQAFAQSDGLSAEVIEQAIGRKIDEIAGKHWDADRGMPMRKAGRWVNGLGEVHKAYYDLEDARSLLDTITRLEAEADAAAADYTAKDRIARQAEDACERFRAFAALLTVQSERRKTILRLESEIGRCREVLAVWPRLTASLERARALKAEQEKRALLDQYDAARTLSDQIGALRGALSSRACPSDREIDAVKAAQRRVTALENRLCGMDLSAAIRMMAGHKLQITSLRTGREIDVSNGTAAITEAVRISIPGVMEMELAPADVSVPETKAALAAQKALIDETLACYAVQSVEELELLAKQMADAQTKIENLSDRLDLLLGGVPYDALEARAKEIPSGIRSRESISQEIAAVCGGEEIVRFIAAKEAVTEGYAREYGSADALEAKVRGAEQELHRAQTSVNAAGEIPAEYADIADPEGHLARLQGESKAAQRIREAALTAKTAAAGKLESCRENLACDPAAACENAQRIYEEKTALLDQWLHIAEVFARQRQSVQDTPLQDIADSFMHYLTQISGGRVSSEFPDLEKLDMSIFSRGSRLDYGKLSEGTKDTVFLAFRLAVLDHLFPEGGVIVFDDPLTDMDSERTAQACALIRECAKRHQVIFLTCRDEYAALLGTEAINI